MRSTALASLVLLLAGCDTTQTEPELYDGPAFGQIGGQVLDLGGAAVADVTVEVQGISALTDGDGIYVVDGVAPADGIAVTFKKAGYAKSYERADLDSWETVNANATLMQIDGTDTFNAIEGGVVQVDKVTVDFPPNAIAYEDGTIYEGTVTVEITHVNPRTDELAAAPGDLRAFARAEDTAGKDVFDNEQLVSYGMVDVTLTDDEGDLLNLKLGQEADIDIPIDQTGLADIYTLSAGDEQDTWSYDPSRLGWIEEGVGTVYEDDEGELMFGFSASHFSWWNCDQGMVPSCAAGKVIDTLDFPVRGAEVACTGGASSSTATTDADGNYVCNVLVGDTVKFEGATFVANRVWDATQGAFFMDGEGSSAADCEPIPDIKIEVCREAGIVMADNLTAHYSETESADIDQLRAWFWDPPGTVSECADPWSDVAMDTCITLVPADNHDRYPDMAADGMPSDTKSVGAWLEIGTGSDAFILEREFIDNRPVYVWDTQQFSDSDGVIGEDDITSEYVEFQGGDNLTASAPGDVSDGMGPISQDDLLTIPADVELNSNAGPLSVRSGETVSFSMRSGSHPDGVMVFGIASRDSDALLCRFTDDGSITVPGAEMSVMGASDNAGLGIYRTEVGWVAGPDGLPIRIQSFSGAVLPVEIQ